MLRAKLSRYDRYQEVIDVCPMGSGMGSTLPREDNWVELLDMGSSKIWLRKLKLRLKDNDLLTTKPPVLPSGSNHFSWSWLFGAVAPRI